MLGKSLLRGVNRHIDMLFFVAQNAPNSDWEKKVTEYFKEKLKENNATNWVRVFFFFFFLFELHFFLSSVVFYTLLQWLAFDKVLPFHDKRAAEFQAQALGCGICTSAALT